MLAGFPTPLTTTIPPRKATLDTSISVVDAQSATAAQAENLLRKTGKQGGNKQGTTAAAGNYTLTQVDLPSSITGTGFMERIQIMTPAGYNPAGPNVPMILVANGYGLSAFSFFNGMSGIPDEAAARGWLICAVTQLDDKSFGAWNKPQGNVTAALNHMVNNYRVDVDRIYAVGWSAGGGSMASYSARHLDPAKPMIAALAVDAGSLDLVDVYDSEVVSVQNIMQNVALFEGPPSGAAYHYNYERTETVFTIQATGALNTNFCQARNLKNIPVYHVYSTDDTIPYLPTQNQMFDTILNGIGANLTTHTSSGLPTPHSWNLLDPVTTLNFLQQYTVNRTPANFQLNADRSDNFYWSTLTQRTTGQYSRIGVTTNLATNALTLTGVSNLSTIKLTPPASALNLAQRLTVSVENQDASSLTLTLKGTALASPSYVLLGSQIFTSWIFDSNGLTLTVPASATSNFTIGYDVYTGVLTAPGTVNIGTNMPLTLTASTPNKPALLLINTFAYPLALSLIDPGDSRYVLVGIDAGAILLPLTFGPSASLSFNVFIPSNPAYINATLSMQFVTYPGFTTIIDEISNLAQTRLQ